MTLWPARLAGALVGVGVVVLLAGLVPAAPNLHAVLARLDPDETSTPATVPAGDSWVTAALQRRVLPQLAESLGLRRFAADLHVVDRTAEALAARADLRSATCVYLELVALERAADAGTTEALDRAAGIGTTREFQRIRDALLRAEVTGRPSWHGLAELAEATGVAELGDLADIMRLSGHDGAAVYATLRARAASLRTQLLTAATAKANAASEHMVVPVALLGVAFMALIGYPAFARILFS